MKQARNSSSGKGRVVKAVLGRRTFAADPGFEAGMARHLAKEFGREYLLELLQRHVHGEDRYAQMMRRVLVKAVARRCGDGLLVGIQVGFKHLETFRIGHSCFIGAGTYIQGRFDGRCDIGNHVWIGPGAYFDARDLVLGDHVGWGPGAKVLGSAHTGVPADVPIIQTDLEIRPVRVGDWADIGTNAVLLPGVRVGKGAIVGAGAVVTQDVPPFAIVAGVPAKFLRWRDGRPSGKRRRGRGAR
ncbi:MAG TPA: acyltransferase [Anaeromyxobacter sp.]|nr:acyltransferase [Anaeromyxobacter sp.]